MDLVNYSETEKIPARPAWKVLQAEYSNARNITKDRWRILHMAFATVPDDVLTTAVLQHMREQPGFFPRVGDLTRQVKRLQETAQVGDGWLLPLHLYHKHITARNWPVCLVCGEHTPDMIDCPFCADIGATS